MPRLPTSRLGRTARFGKMAATAAIKRDDPVAAADQIVDTLGSMKGAAMKIGQVLSTIDFDIVAEEDRERFKERLAALRDQAPSVPFRQMERLLTKDLGAPVDEVFARFDTEPVAAASIGQVYRAQLRDGRDVAVKVQYPGIAEAVETDLRNMNLLFPLIRRIAPGVDVKALGAELRERIAEELDYEIEAQNQRRVSRAFRGHPHVVVPDVVTSLSTRRVLVSEFVDGEGFEAIKRRPQEERDRFGEILYRFFYGLLMQEDLAAGDPHPGNQLLTPDGRVCFLDFGLMRQIPSEYLEAERRLARAILAGDATETHRSMGELGYLPEPGQFEPERVLAQLSAAGEWFLEPGFRRLDPEYVRKTVEVSSSPRSPFFDQMRRQTVPPEALLLRRMEGLLFSVLGELRAGADWGRIAREYLVGDPPSTPLGEADAAFWGTDQAWRPSPSTASTT